MNIRSLFNLLIILGFYIGFIVLIKSKFTNTQDFIEAIKNIYLTKGYVLIFFSALLEAMFIVGFYIPGSAIIILGAVFARTGVISYPLVLLVGTSGLVLGYSINYFLGKYGWYHLLSKLGFEKGIEVAKRKLAQNRIKTLFLGYITPNSASFISTAAGALRMPIKKFIFLSVAAQLFWSFIWGTLAYWFGLPFVEFIIKYSFIALFLLVGIWIVRKMIGEKSRLWGF